MANRAFIFAGDRDTTGSGPSLSAPSRVPSSPPSALDVERLIQEAVAAGKVRRVPQGESGLPKDMSHRVDYMPRHPAGGTVASSAANEGDDE